MLNYESPTPDAPECEIGTSAVRWAETHGRRHVWSAALDNYEPTRDYAQGELYAYLLHGTREGERGLVLIPEHGMKDTRSSLYLIDDGRTVEPMYVSGWKDSDDADEALPQYVLLKPFPTNYDADGERRYRADDQTRPVDFGSWMLGSRRTYHLKVSEI